MQCEGGNHKRCTSKFLGGHNDNFGFLPNVDRAMRGPCVAKGVRTASFETAHFKSAPELGVWLENGYFWVFCPKCKKRKTGSVWPKMGDFRVKLW
jgi:hypothetical protein